MYWSWYNLFHILSYQNWKYLALNWKCLALVEHYARQDFVLSYIIGFKVDIATVHFLVAAVA